MLLNKSIAVAFKQRLFRFKQEESGFSHIDYSCRLSSCDAAALHLSATALQSDIYRMLQS